MLQKAYDESTFSKTQAFECYKAFNEIREEIEDLPCIGQSSTSSTNEDTEKVREQVMENQ